MSVSLRTNCSCLILRLVLCVGNTADWIPDLIERAQNLKLGNGFDTADLYELLFHL